MRVTLGSLKSGVMGAQSLKINLSQLSEYVEENLPRNNEQSTLLRKCFLLK